MKTSSSIQNIKNKPFRFCIAKDVIKPVLLLASIVGACLQANSQVDQRIAMADKYFNAGEYFTAAGLYEQYLNPPKKEIPKADFPLNTRRYNQAGSGSVNKFDILYKQAESYRLANYLADAATKYKECFEKDFTKYADAFYWYAVCQRNLGKYAAAEEYLNRFIKLTAANDSRKQDAEKELQTIQYIKSQISRPDSILFKVKKNNTSFGKEKGIFALNAANNSRFIYTSTVTEPTNKQGDNPGHSRMFYATMNNDVLENIQQVSIDGIDATMNQGAACMSADGKTLYFTQWKKENGKSISSIYYSIKQDNAWGKPVLLTSINKQGFSSKQPFCTADGKTLYFASDMPGGSGGFDIWYATIEPDGTTNTPVNAGAINTKEDEQAPFFHNTSNTLVFSSNGLQGMGGYDLFSSKLNGSSFDKPENLGHPINSSRDDIYFFAPEEKGLLANAIIGSDRGSECCLETYTVVKAPKKKMITGVILDCKTNQPVAGAAVNMKDFSGKNASAVTGTDGKFSFELTGNMGQQSFNISKENYKEKMMLSSAESVNESDLLTDVYNNTPLCIEPIIKEEKKLEIKAENVVSLYFDFDKSILKEREMQILDSVYNILGENKTYTIQISGYTDGMGTDDYNKKLSDRRAKAAADYLKKKGIEAARISFVSFGKCCPVEMEIINGRDNPDGRSKNRRALINISKEE